MKRAAPSSPPASHRVPAFPARCSVSRARPVTRRPGGEVRRRRPACFAAAGERRRRPPAWSWSGSGGTSHPGSDPPCGAWPRHRQPFSGAHRWNVDRGWELATRGGNAAGPPPATRRSPGWRSPLKAGGRTSGPVARIARAPLRGLPSGPPRLNGQSAFRGIGAGGG